MLREARYLCMFTLFLETERCGLGPSEKVELGKERNVSVRYGRTPCCRQRPEECRLTLCRLQGTRY